jgi:hypothetical protein
MRTVAALVAVLACVASASVLSGLKSDIKHGLRHVEAGLSNLPMCGTLANANAVVAFTFASEGACEAYAANRVLGGSVGGTWSNCTSGTFCTGFSYAVSGTVVGYPVIGVAMFNIGSGSFTFDSADTTKGVVQSYSNSFLPATVQTSGSAITVTGDCSGTYGSFSLPSDPASNTSIWAFNFASC